jgi:hypothetical protein
MSVSGLLGCEPRPAALSEGYDRGGTPAIDVRCGNTISISSMSTNYCSLQRPLMNNLLIHDARKNS